MGLRRESAREQEAHQGPEVAPAWTVRWGQSSRATCPQGGQAPPLDASLARLKDRKDSRSRNQRRPRERRVWSKVMHRAGAHAKWKEGPVTRFPGRVSCLLPLSCHTAPPPFRCHAPLCRQCAACGRLPSFSWPLPRSPPRLALAAS